MSDDTIKIKKPARVKKPKDHIPNLQELKDGLMEFLEKQSIDATLVHMRAAISNGMKFIDIPFIINQEQDYILYKRVLDRIKGAGYDVQTIKKDVQTGKFPDGTEFSRTTIMNRYFLEERDSQQESPAMKSFDRFKKIVNDDLL
jgi:hypothetical protein